MLLDYCNFPSSHRQKTTISKMWEKDSFQLTLIPSSSPLKQRRPLVFDVIPPSTPMRWKPKAINQQLISTSLVSNTMKITLKIFIAMYAPNESRKSWIQVERCCQSKTGISWYDPAKRKIFDSFLIVSLGAQDTRKLIDLSSNSVFGWCHMYEASIEGSDWQRIKKRD